MIIPAMRSCVQDDCLPHHPVLASSMRIIKIRYWHHDSVVSTFIGELSTDDYVSNRIVAARRQMLCVHVVMRVCSHRSLSSMHTRTDQCTRVTQELG